VIAAIVALVALVPHLTMPSPWARVSPPPATAVSTSLAEYALPNALPKQDTSNTQYVLLVRKAMDDGGFGGYISDLEYTLQQNRDVTGLHFEPIEDCPRRAWHFTYVVPLGGVSRTFEESYVATSEYIYRLEYFRPTDQPENAAARDAVTAFCKWQTPV